MIRTSLRFHTPADAKEAVSILAAHRDGAAVLGGGTVIVPLMSRGERAVEHVVDLGRLGLDRIELVDDRVILGARVTYRQILGSALCRARVPLLVEVAAGITGGVQLRNRATLAGSACHANPASDAPAVLVALDGVMRTQGPTGQRQLSAAEFFLDAFASALCPDELLTSITVATDVTAHGYRKLKHCEGSWPIVTAAAVRRSDGRCTVTVGGARATPLHVEDATAVDEAVAEGLARPWSDELATGEYRRAVAGAVARRALGLVAGGGA